MIQFNIPAVAPDLIGGLGRGDDSDKLAKRFGSRWGKTPTANVWMISDRENVQVTLSTSKDGQEVLTYYTGTLASFKANFMSGTLSGTARPLDPVYKYTGLQVIQDLKDLGLW